MKTSTEYVLKAQKQLHKMFADTAESATERATAYEILDALEQLEEELNAFVAYAREVVATLEPEEDTYEEHLVWYYHQLVEKFSG